MLTVKERGWKSVLQKRTGLASPQGNLVSQMVFSPQTHAVQAMTRDSQKRAHDFLSLQKEHVSQSVEISWAPTLVAPEDEFCHSDGYGDAPKQWRRSQMNIPFAKQHEYSVLDTVSSHSRIYLFLNSKNVLRVPSRPKWYTMFTTRFYTHQFYPAWLLLIKPFCLEIPWFPWNHPLRHNLSK